MSVSRIFYAYLIILVTIALRPTLAAGEPVTLKGAGEYRIGRWDSPADARWFASLKARRKGLNRARKLLAGPLEKEEIREDLIKLLAPSLIDFKENGFEIEASRRGDLYRIELQAAFDPEAVASSIISTQRNIHLRRRLTASRKENRGYLKEIIKKTKALRRTSDDLQIKKLLAERRDAMDLYEANRLIDKAWASLAGNGPEWLNRFKVSAKRRQRARKNIENVLALTPRSAEAHRVMGVILYQEGDREAAVAQHRQGIAIDPNFVEGHIYLAHSLCGISRCSEALDEYEKAVSLDPGNGYAHHSLGLFVQGYMHYRQAIDEYKKALELDPEVTNAQRDIGRALQKMDRLEEAVQAFRKAVELDPLNACNHDSLGQALRKQGDLEGALKESAIAVTLKPEYAIHHCHLADYFWDRNDFDSAIAEFRRTLEIKPDYEYIHQSLFFCCILGGHFIEAGKWFISMPWKEKSYLVTLGSVLFGAFSLLVHIFRKYSKEGRSSRR